MFKVIQLGAAPASLRLLSPQMYASSPESKRPKKELLKVDELSLYSSPAHESKYVEDPQTTLEEEISHLRHFMEPYVSRCQDLYTKAMPNVEKAVERDREGCEFLKNPPAGVYPRLGVIGFAGMVGLFLARGSEIKRLVYAVGFTGIGASLYYPRQAVAIAKNDADGDKPVGIHAPSDAERAMKENMLHNFLSKQVNRRYRQDQHFSGEEEDRGTCFDL